MSEFAELSDNQKTEILSASLALMRSITEMWGAERGMELWDSIANTLGADIKGELFFGMMTGKYGTSKVTVFKLATTQWVDAIKAVRLATGMGLKDAKDFCDAVRNNGKVMVADCSSPDAARNLIHDLRELGDCEVR